MTSHFKYNLKCVVVILNILVLTNCDSVVIWPTIAITTEPSEVSQAYATLNGRAIIDNFTTIGFDYGTTTEYGNETQNFVNIQVTGKYTSVSCLLTTLSPGTTYHYRIKIKSSAGIIYGKDVVFSTADNTVIFNSDLNYGSVSDIDGNNYKTIEIGTQTWMAENLKTTKLNDGTPVKLATDPGEWWKSGTASYCWVNNEENKFRDTYGALYNWYAVNTLKLCPEGWHVPDNEEWLAFVTYLGGPINIGNKIKEAGGSHWLNPGANTTNESGFTALPAGYRNFNGPFKPGSDYAYWRGSEAYWWSSSSAFAGGAYYNGIYANSNSLLKGSWIIEMGLSVRCVKDN
jgi:uncharacterized protein (TIGR02145 family)